MNESVDMTRCRTNPAAPGSLTADLGALARLISSAPPAEVRQLFSAVRGLEARAALVADGTEVDPYDDDAFERWKVGALLFSDADLWQLAVFRGLVDDDPAP